MKVPGKQQIFCLAEKTLVERSFDAVRQGKIGFAVYLE